MKTCWLLSQEIPNDFVDREILTSVAPIWGPLTIWKQYQCDNTICYNLKDARDMIKRAFHAVTHFYVPKDFYADLGRPVGVRMFEGEFKDNAISNKEDIIGLNLVAPAHDIVLLVGFNLGPVSDELDPIEQRFLKAYRHNIKTIIQDNPNTQFVLVNYEQELAENFKDLDNLTIDTVDSVVELLI